MKKRIVPALLAAAVYILLLAVLIWSEAADPAASIRTFGDAVWYSLVTLTTVGYGDLSPVTPVGRLVGIVMVLCSLGLLTALISVAVSFLQGRLLPRLQLYRLRRRKWYLFDSDSSEVRIFCRRLAEQEPDCVILLPAAADETGKKLSSTTFLWAGSMEEAIRFHGKIGSTELFFLSENGYENYRNAVDALSFVCPVYCKTDCFPERVPEGLVLYHEADSLGRVYWQQHPVEKCEKSIVLIGGSDEAEAILEQALLNNVLESEKHLQYHVFSDNGRFLRAHYSLDQVLSLGSLCETRDSLLFHEDSWQSHPDLIRTADRIILCLDSEEANLDTLSALRKYFVTQGQIHIHLGRDLSLDNAAVFGTADSLLQPEYIMRQQLDALAKQMHEIYRKNADYPVPAWEELSEFLRQSNQAAADHLSVKIRLLLDLQGPAAVTPELCSKAYARYQADKNAEGGHRFWELEHRRWMRFHAIRNWHYAPTRNNALREHPLMVPYENLSFDEQRKDDYAWSLLSALSESQTAAQEES